MNETAVKIENVKKQYKLGIIGGRTLNAELQSWWARKRGKEDPNLHIGQSYDTTGDTFWALNGINLEIKKGEALGIIGSNGAGKSTLLKILSRVTAPTEGNIWIDGRVASMLEVGTGFHGELTGRENIYMNGAILGMTKKEVDKKIESIINFSECRQFIDTPVKRYSSGMYVKLAFAVASHLDAEIMIMDEVLAVGDMNFQKKCLDKMSDAANNEKKTVLYVSHNMTTIQNLCTTCIVLDKGKVIFNGNVDDAIQIYMRCSRGELVSHYDFTSFKRANWELGQKCFIRYLTFLNKESAIFNSSDPIVIEIEWEAYVDLTDIKFLMSLRRADGTAIGLSESDIMLSQAKKGLHVSKCCLDISNIAEGMYFLYFDISQINHIMQVHELDQTGKIPIEVINTDESVISWESRYFGSIRLNHLIMQKES